MKPWLVITTEQSKEAKTEAALIEAGYEVYLPMWPTDKPVSSKTKRKRVTYAPLIPRAVFAYVRSRPEHVFRVKGVKGCLRNASGEALSASDVEMLRFRTNLEMLTESLVKPGKGLSKKQDPKKGNMADKEFMKKAMKLMFGMETTE
jgi:hypothetical protein